MRSKIKIVNGQEMDTLERLIAKPDYRGVFVFEDSELVYVNMGKSVVMLNKPIYLGQAILDISKTLMYNFHYEYVKPKYRDRMRLLFTDTDSLCYRIQTGGLLRGLLWFDTNNYPKGHPIGGTNKKVIRMMKDETGGKSISEFVGLRSKFYTYVNGVMHQGRFNSLRSRRHEIATECITKIALSTNDDKRYIIPNDPEHQALALGHYTINDCKDSRPEMQYNEDINIRKRFLTSLQVSKGAEVLREIFT